MDLDQYFGSGEFLTLDDVRPGPLAGTIQSIAVDPNPDGRGSPVVLNLSLPKRGPCRVRLNKSSYERLRNEWGSKSENWLGKRVVIKVGLARTPRGMVESVQLFAYDELTGEIREPELPS
jgi:hypothetical protein